MGRRERNKEMCEQNMWFLGKNYGITPVTLVDGIVRQGRKLLENPYFLGIAVVLVGGGIWYYK